MARPVDREDGVSRVDVDTSAVWRGGLRAPGRRMMRGVSCRTSRDSFPGATIEHLNLSASYWARVTSSVKFAACTNTKRMEQTVGVARNRSYRLLSHGLIASNLPLYRTHALKVTGSTRSMRANHLDSFAAFDNRRTKRASA